MLDRFKAAFEAFTTAIPGPIGAAAKAYVKAAPAALNFPNSAIMGSKGPKDVAGIINSLPISHLRDYESYLQAVSKKVWAAWKAGDIISKIVQETPRSIIRDGGSGDPVNVPELTPLLAQANDRETFNEMLARMVFHLKFTGNAFIAKDQVDLQGNRPKALYLLNPRRVILALGKSGEVIGYTYIVGNGFAIPFTANEVIHIKLPHPDRDYWGLGEVEAAEDLYQENINRQTWTEKFWQNGASPSGILFQKDNQVTNPEQWEEAKAKFQKQYGGPANSGKTAWLSGDWGYMQMGLTAQEMQSIESATWNVEKIFILAGVPLSVAGIKEAANYATAQTDEVRMRRYTVKPLVTNIEDKLNSGLVQGFGDGLRLKFSVQGLIDVELSSRAVPLLVGAGIMSPNDGREYIGLPRRDDPTMDEYYLSNTLVPIALAGMSGGDQTQGQAQEVIKRFVLRELEERSAADRQEVRRLIEDSAKHANAKPHSTDRSR